MLVGLALVASETKDSLCWFFRQLKAHLPELATADNPPMLLPCGHVLALGSVTKLARGARSARFKCPYCPAECTTTATQALTI